jgi:glycosyltransferase involved in cell wall biosynthesis
VTEGSALRIALLSYEYPRETGFGGIGTYTWHHARGLAKLGHNVHVLAGARQPTGLRSMTKDGVRVHRFWADGMAMRAFHGLGRFRLWWTRQRLQNALSMYRGIAALHRELRFDVIEMPECGAEGGLVTRLVDVPTVVRLHSPSRLIMPFYDVRRSDTVLCSAIERPALSAASALTACSQFVADEVARTMKVSRAIRVITNGLDVEWFDGLAEPVDVFERYGVPKRELLIVFTGRMERRKGIHLCADIMTPILERFDVTFALAGDDLFGYVAQLLPALASRRLKGSIHWLGPLGLPEVRQLVGAADVVLLPSLWENCPYACLEAMAAGRAIVATDQGGIPELITNDANGLLATSGDPASFARQIERLIEDQPLRSRLGRTARATIERNHGDVHVARQTVGLYRTLVGERPGAAS